MPMNGVPTGPNRIRVVQNLTITPGNFMLLKEDAGMMQKPPARFAAGAFLSAVPEFLHLITT